MPLPYVTAQGNLGQDPELRYTQAGNPWTHLRLACTERRKNHAGDWEDAGTTWLDVTVWGHQAEPAAELTKGARLTVTGRLEQREHDGKTYYGLRADHVARDLQGTTKPAQRTQGGHDTQDPWATPLKPSDAWAPQATLPTNDEPPF